MPDFSPREFAALYGRFPSPITRFDCGQKCSPYNENGVPFCCDTRHAVPIAYTAEWEYLQVSTDLWHAWQGGTPEETSRLEAETPPGQVLIACQGHTRCQRSFRSLACRAFPFFPYITPEGEFAGLSYYWEYEDRCWVISHLEAVTPEFLAEFMAVYDEIFARRPEEIDQFEAFSAEMRRIFVRRKRLIPLLGRDGNCYKISPTSGQRRHVHPDRLPKFGPYRVAVLLPFPGE